MILRQSSVIILYAGIDPVSPIVPFDKIPPSYGEEAFRWTIYANDRVSFSDIALHATISFSIIVSARSVEMTGHVFDILP